VRHPDYPHASSYKDRHGKARWRFRRAGRTVQLPQAPGHPDFDKAYTAALEGRQKPQPASVVRLPGQAAPKSLKAAWTILRQHDPEWQALGPDIRTAQTRIAERFLIAPVVPGEPLTFGEVALEHLKRKHIKALLAERSDTPHAAAHLLRVIRKLIGVGLDQEWIEVDPSYRLKYRPEYGGWKAWPNDMLKPSALQVRQILRRERREEAGASCDGDDQPAHAPRLHQKVMHRVDLLLHVVELVCDVVDVGFKADHPVARVVVHFGAYLQLAGRGKASVYLTGGWGLIRPPKPSRTILTTILTP